MKARWKVARMSAEGAIEESHIYLDIPKGLDGDGRVGLALFLAIGQLDAGGPPTGYGYDVLHLEPDIFHPDHAVTAMFRDPDTGVQWRIQEEPE